MSVSFYTGDCIEGPNLTNTTFHEILSLINYSEREEELMENGLSGYDLIEFGMRLNDLTALIKAIPEQFHTETIVDGNVIHLGKEPEYYLRKIEEINNFISQYYSIYFA